jgi:enoyl-CoA hydratase/carnithine racemase
MLPPASTLRRATTLGSRFPASRSRLTPLDRRRCRGSPLSQKVTLRALRAARGQRLGQVLRSDFRIVVRMVAGPSDFDEGVRATLIDRDGKPHWTPATLEQVQSLVP